MKGEKIYFLKKNKNLVTVVATGQRKWVTEVKDSFLFLKTMYKYIYTYMYDL